MNGQGKREALSTQQFLGEIDIDFRRLQVLEKPTWFKYVYISTGHCRMLVPLVEQAGSQQDCTKPLGNATI